MGAETSVRVSVENRDAIFDIMCDRRLDSMNDAVGLLLEEFNGGNGKTKHAEDSRNGRHSG